MFAEFTALVSAGVVLSVLSALALAVQSLCIRYGTVSNRSSDALVFVLTSNIAVLVPVAMLFGSPLETLTPRSIAAFGAAGLVGTMAGRAFYFEAIKRVGSSRTEPLRAAQPLAASAVAVVVLGELVGPVHALSIVLIVVGVALISWETTSNGGGPGDVDRLDLLFPLLGAFFYGVEPIFAKLGFEEGVGVLTGLAIKTAVASAGFLGYLAWQNALPSLRSYASRDTRWYAFAGISNTAFLLAYYQALEIERVVVVVPIIQITPFLVLVLSVLFVSDSLERPTWRLAVYTTVVISGAIGVTIYG